MRGLWKGFESFGEDAQRQIEILSEMFNLEWA
jgi:hypothetical protein